MAAWGQFCRYLVLGTTTSTVKAHHTCDLECIDILCRDGRVHDMLVHLMDLCDRGYRTPYLVCALSRILKGSPRHRAYIFWEVVPVVCHDLGTLLQFLSIIPKAWGRSTRRALEQWLFRFTPRELAFAMTSIHKRKGRMTPKDLLRVVHPRPHICACYAEEYSELFSFITDKWHDTTTFSFHEFLEDLNVIHHSSLANEVASLIKEHNLGVGHVRCKALLQDASIWNALLHSSATTPLDVLANLNTLLEMPSLDTAAVCKMLTCSSTLAAYHVKPLTILHAIRTLPSHVPHEVRLALETALYHTLNTESQLSCQHFLLALDVSGSMATSTCKGVPSLTAREASAIMAMSLLRTHANVHIHAFSDTFRKLSLTATDSFVDVMNTLSHLSFDDTECCVPLQYALHNNLYVDCFMIITDGDIRMDMMHMYLQKYQECVNPNAKLVLVMTSTSKSCLPDAYDPCVLEVIGIPSNIMSMIYAFSA